MSLTHEIYMKHYGNKESMKKKKPERNRVFDPKTKTYFYYSCPRCGREINGPTPVLEEHILGGDCPMTFKIVEAIKSKVPWWKESVAPNSQETIPKPTTPQPTPRPTPFVGVKTKEEVDKIIDEAFE
jgi:hypothetical protein